MPAAGEDRKFAVFGALDYGSGELSWHLSPHKDSAAFLAFLDQLVARYPDEALVLVLDNVGYHKSRAVRAWLVEHQEHVQPFWLPVYSPELNLIERVWRHLKEKLSCHRWWADLDALQQATATLLDCLQARFHHAPSPRIRLVQNFRQSA